MMKSRKIVFIIGLFSLLSLSGCVQLAENLYLDTRVGDSLASGPVPGRLSAGTSVEGRPIHYEVLGRGSEIILIMASIHGSEPAGTPLVRQLARYLKRRPDLLRGRQVVLIPVANPDGIAHATRTNAKGIDLNRNFAAANRQNSRRYGSQPLSEPESRALDQLLWRYTPDRIVTIHQPLEVVDFDGPGKRLARAMGRETDLPVKKLGARPGSLGAYAGEILGIPIITLELPPDVQLLGTEQLWKDYGPSLLAAIRYREDRKVEQPVMSPRLHLDW